MTLPAALGVEVVVAPLYGVVSSLASLEIRRWICPSMIFGRPVLLPPEIQPIFSRFCSSLLESRRPAFQLLFLQLQPVFAPRPPSLLHFIHIAEVAGRGPLFVARTTVLNLRRTPCSFEPC